MGETKIEWADFTFNGWIGCTKVSAACDHCYAEVATPTRTMRASGRETWGPHAPRQQTSDANWKKPLAWNRKALADGRRYRVFCASLADVFDNHPSIKLEWREDLWRLIHATPYLDWLLLTKRPQNVPRIVPGWIGPHSWPSNVWLGTTVENQTEAERRIPHLLAAPAAVRFLSVEPMLGPVDLTRLDMLNIFRILRAADDDLYPRNFFDALRGKSDIHPLHNAEPQWGALDWVICGGESGPGARPMHPDWARSLRDQCQAAGVPFFFKQWGKWLHESQDPNDLWDWSDADDRGILHHWFDAEQVTASIPLKGKTSGRLLDGRTWDEVPDKAIA